VPPGSDHQGLATKSGSFVPQSVEAEVADQIADLYGKIIARFTSIN
jgi:hypothetical protein